MDFRRLISAPIAVAAAVFVAIGAFLVSDRFKSAWIWLVLLLVFIALAALIAFLVWRRWRALQAAEQIEKSIVIQADKAIEKSTFGQIDEMKNLKKDLLVAIEALKKSSVVKRAGADALSQLPWIMILGPADSGKGTLVRRSGLHFVLKDDDKKPRSVKGIGGTRAFEWWLTEEGVLLDMSGRTLKRSEFDDADDWEEFLATLRDNRPGRALNGVVVAVAVDQLADQPDARIDGLAQQVRDRILDLTARLKVVFPVYVIFTRCDRIAGFPEFFEDSPPEERDGIWGATFKQARSRAARADALFREEFGHMLGALSDRRLRRASALPDAVQRARAFVFPLQLERLQAPLARFMGGVFKGDSREEFGWLRGFYFASAYAGAESDDRVLRPAVQALGLTMAPAAVPPVGDAAWFAQDLFTGIVFPDAPLATVSRRAIDDQEAAERRKRLFSGVVFAALALVLSVWSCANLSVIGRARDAARGTRGISTLRSPSTVPLETLESLDRLRRSADELDANHENRPFLPPFYATAGGLRDDATATLARRSTQAVYGLAGHTLHAGLEDALLRPDSRFVDVFLRYRAWRMLTADRVSVVPEDAPVLGMVVDSALADSREGARLHSGRPEDAERFSKLVRQQVSFYAGHASRPRGFLNVDSPDLQVDPDLDARVAEWLVGHWDTQQLYDRLVADENAAFPAVDLARLVGAPTLLTGSYSVPGAFTRTAWKEGVYPRMLWTDNQLAVDKPLQQAFQAAGQAPPQVLGDLVVRYAADYTREWINLVRDARVALPRAAGTFDYKVSATAVDLASYGDSQIHRLIAAVREQTHFDKDPGATSLASVSRDFDATQTFFANPEMESARRVSWWKRPFVWISGLFHRVGPSAGNVSKSELTRSYQELMKQARSDLNKVANADPTANFAQATTTAGSKFFNTIEGPLRATGQGQAALDAIVALLRAPLTFAFGGSAPSPTPTPRDGGGASPYAAALRSALGNAWDAQLAPFYPFRRDAGTDVDPEAFKQFFGPGGQFWTALKTAGLDKLVDEKGDPVAPDAGGVPGDLRACIRRAFEIRQALFSSGDPGMKVLVEPEQVDAPASGPTIDWMELRLGNGEPYRYESNGYAEERAMDWPGDVPDAGAIVSVQRGTRPVSAEGLWGLFHALDRAERRDSGPQVRATWSLTAGGASVRLTWNLRVAKAPRNPFQRDFFTGFRLP